jgi:hypothetical protein
MRMMDIDKPQEPRPFLETKTRTELESDLEQCLERKRNLEEEKNALHNLRIDLETVLKQREEELSHVRAQQESLYSAKEKAERELESVQRMRAGDQNSIEELNQKIHLRERENLDLQEENKELRDLLEVAERDRETYRVYSDEAEKLIEIKTGKLQADLREMQQANEGYRKEIQNMNERVKEYAEEIQRVIEEKETLEQQMLTRKDIQVVSTEFMGELGTKLEDLQRLVRKFGDRAPIEMLEKEREIGLQKEFEQIVKPVEEGEFEVEEREPTETPEYEGNGEEYKEIEEGEIGRTEEREEIEEYKEIEEGEIGRTEEREEPEEHKGLEDLGDLEEFSTESEEHKGLEDLGDLEEFSIEPEEHGESEVDTVEESGEKPTERTWGEKLWEEPSEPKLEEDKPGIQEMKTKEKFPWEEDEDEKELGWGF